MKVSARCKLKTNTEKFLILLNLREKKRNMSKTLETKIEIKIVRDEEVTEKYLINTHRKTKRKTAHRLKIE